MCVCMCKLCTNVCINRCRYVCIHYAICTILFSDQSFFTFDNGIVPLAMFYDWIAKKLFLAVRNGTQLMIYYLLDVGDIEDRNMIHVYTSKIPISVEFQTELTINPFKG